MNKVGSEICEEMISSEKLTMVKFSASWCGPCKMLTPILDGIAGKYPDINMVEIDVDEEMALASKEGIRGVPTVIFYKKGEVLSKLVGIQPAKVYTEKIDSFK